MGLSCGIETTPDEQKGRHPLLDILRRWRMEHHRWPASGNGSADGVENTAPATMATRLAGAFYLTAYSSDLPPSRRISHSSPVRNRRYDCHG
jgi:hypothetical protein